MVNKIEVVTPTEVRQASRHRLNLRVLVYSLTLAAIAAAIFFFVISASPPSTTGTNDQTVAPTTSEQRIP